MEKRSCQNCKYGVSFSKRDYPPGALNLVWFIIALIAIARMVF
jgi:hypothetical protein